MIVKKLILESNHSIKLLQSLQEGIRLGNHPFFLIIRENLCYSSLSKEKNTRGNDDGAHCKQRGIWWLGRNRFIRVVASVTSFGSGGGFGKGSASSALWEIREG